jgi:hypothetical protein
MRRTDLMDTKPEVHREIVRRLRAMTPTERLRMTLWRIELGWMIHDAALTRLGLTRDEWNLKHR